MIPLRHLLAIFLLAGCIARLRAQTTDSLVILSDFSRETLEDFIQNNAVDESFDFNAVFELLNSYLKKPLDLNQASEEQLRELFLLTDGQILQFLRHRRISGKLLSIYELQAIPGFDRETIDKVRPFLRVGGGIDDFNVGIQEMLREGDNELFLRWARVLETSRGYEPAGDAGAQRYLGDPNQWYLRYRHRYGNRLSYGLTMEKDPGEEFFTGSNPRGFDFYSAHFYLRDYRSWLQAVAIGDYAISFGQGLVLFSGYSYGKSAFATSIKRTSPTIRPYSSVNEAIFMRGAAVTLAPAPGWEATVFASSRRRDGNLLEPDTLENDQIFQGFTSFDLDGFHRTPAEIADEGAFRQFTTGGNIRYNWNDNHLALNVLYDQFDKPLQRPPQPYNRFFFNGDRILNASLDYTFLWRNLNFFGETAWSDNGALATLNGLLLGLDRKLDLAILVRHFPADYQALNASPFAETNGGVNETGAYLGLEWRPIPNWTFSGYFDAWEHPWLRFQADAPSRGHEYRARITYEKRRRRRIYLEARYERKERNAPDNDTPLNYLVDFNLFQTRLHIANQLSKTLELRTRLDWGYAENPVDGRSTGFAMLQDILFRPDGFPLSFTARYALFDTDGYQIRFYHFENDLLNTFSIPAYYQRGSRFYLNLRYRPLSNLTLEARIAQTFWSNQPTIGSALDAIDGQVRTQARAQVKVRF